MSTCSVADCGRKPIAKGLCGGHYKRLSYGLPLDAPLRRHVSGRGTCSIEGCDRTHAARGLCRLHISREMNGTPMDQPVRTFLKTDVPLLERLRAYAPEQGSNECWEWTRARVKNYGMMSVGDGKLRGAHIVAWELATGQPLPPGMVVRHSCDNPPCTNPAHLVLSTQEGNIADKVAKGRQDAGEKHGIAKLTDEDVVAICNLYDEGWSQRRIATRFGISQANVSFLVRGYGWKHIDAPRLEPGARPRHIKLTEDDVRQIRALYASGSWSQKRLAHQFGVSSGLVSGIVNRKIWAMVV